MEKYQEKNMCGIAGFVGQRFIQTNQRKQMLNALQKRGPNGLHQISWNNLQRNINPENPANMAILHARLSVQDVRQIADQPMNSANAENVFICYNGEIYDYQTCKNDDLIKNLGYKFRTNSDTEFILNAYLAFAERGKNFQKFLSKLRGMFAFAILDLREKNQPLLFLVRDRLGLKPLNFYYQKGDGLAFASLIRALLPYLPKNQRDFDFQSVEAFLTHRYIPSPKTIFEKIQRLPQSHYLRYDISADELQIFKYWENPLISKKFSENLVENLPNSNFDEVKNELYQAVKIRTISDRPLGVFLSSGVDSSAVATILSEQNFRQFPTFTASFDNPKYDESQAAKKISEALNFENITLKIPQNFDKSEFSQIVSDLDEPFADPSAFPTWFLSKATSQKVVVVLGGDGGDEIFAGYKRYAKHLRTAWRKNFRFGNFVSLPSLKNKGLAKFADEMQISWLDAYVLRFSGFTPSQRRFLLKNKNKNKNLEKIHFWLQENSENSANLSPLQELMQIDFANTLPEYILKKADLCTMAHGLELRSPMLDHIFLEKLAKLAILSPQKIFTKPAKYLLNEMIFSQNQHLQKHQIDLFNQKKKGFNPPLNAWLEQDFFKKNISNLVENLQQILLDFFDSKNLQEFLNFYYQQNKGYQSLAEQVLQLFILEESLQQLNSLKVNV